MRPKDEEGRLLPQAHKRLDDAPTLEQAAVFRMSDDGRLSFMPLKRKLAIARKAIDHVVDGDAEPKALFRKTDNTALTDAWRAACDAIREARA
ncbi:hypothetical protein [Brevundimonas nasdae]|uniref:hypothetical protein n=1 Tax=Brevundimonas nasdae TaxID=172043 RepID=UPI002898F43F|nr:hypothetical protein [Brevundimonas nasdae]